MNADIRDLNSRVAGQSQNLLDDEAVRVLETEIAGWQKALEENKLELEKESRSLQSVETRYKAEKQKFDEEEQRLRRFNALKGELGQLQERLAGLTLQRENLDKKSAGLLQQKEKLGVSAREFATCSFTCFSFTAASAKARLPQKAQYAEDRVLVPDLRPLALP